ncbi:MAG TPA: hypothetical protein V6D47_01800 [Oscillatoriaceae cyanobacterium]
MDERLRQLRWLLLFRLLTLGTAVMLLPAKVTLPVQLVPWLWMWGIGAVLLWSTPLWGPAWREERMLGLGALIDAIATSALVYRFGQANSPFALLYLPLLIQAAVLLRKPGYALAALYAAAGYAMAVMPSVSAGYYPAWTPLLVAGVGLLIGWVGLMGATLRRERAQRVRSRRRYRDYRELVEWLPHAREDAAFWRAFLARVEHAGGFTDGALLRWEGAQLRVVASDRTEAWERFAKRHSKRLLNGVARGGTSEFFVEEREHPRAIACWPVPALDREAAVLCLLAPEVLETREVGRRLKPWLPLAAIALALGPAHLSLHRAPVDWRVLMNATLHRLHERLKDYLVLVHVDQGVIEADALLLADAIAHVIEDALDRVPRGSHVRLSVRRAPDGWHFEVTSSATPAPAAPESRPGLLLAQQVVAAHGGEWRAMASPKGLLLGFTLPPKAA